MMLHRNVRIWMYRRHGGFLLEWLVAIVTWPTESSLYAQWNHLRYCAWACTGDSLFGAKDWISNLIEAYRLPIVVEAQIALWISNIKTVNIMNVQLDISLSLWHKNAFMNLNRFNWLRYAVIHMYSIQYCNEEGIVCRGGETLQSAVFILLSFAHTQKSFVSFCMVHPFFCLCLLRMFFKMMLL